MLNEIQEFLRISDNVNKEQGNHHKNKCKYIVSFHPYETFTYVVAAVAYDQRRLMDHKAATIFTTPQAGTINNFLFEFFKR